MITAEVFLAVSPILVVVLGGTLLMLAEAFSRTKPATVLVAAAVEPLPPLPAPEAPATAAAPAALTVTPAPEAAKDAPATASTASERPSAGPGFVMTLGSGGSYVGGAIVEGVALGAGLVTFDLKLGGYITPHVGILAGVQGGFGALFEGCSGTCSKAVHYQIPIVAQYAFEDRTKGAYLEGGIGIVSTYRASTDSEKNPDQAPESLEASAPFDFKLGVGYRIPISAVRDKVATSAFDLRLGADLGQFKKIDYRTVGVELAGDVVNDRQAMHFALGFSAGYHFAP